MVTPVSIIIPAHNQLDYCRQCIESILRHTHSPYTLILIDNGSTDGVAEYFDSIHGAVVIHSEKNVGYPAGINLGLARATGHVLLLNSDTIVPNNWLTRLVTALECTPRIGLVGPMSNSVSGPQRLPDLNFASISEINDHADSLARDRAGRLIEVERLVGFCMLVRNTAFEAVGGLDESFGIGNFEDDDYCLRVRKAGFRVCIAEDCFVFHYGSRTFSGMGYDNAAYSALIAANETTFDNKWGINPGESRTRRIADNLLGDAKAAADSGGFIEAISRIKEAVALSPANAAAYCMLGELLLKMGRKDEAFEQFRRVLRIDPEHVYAKQQLLRHVAD